MIYYLEGGSHIRYCFKFILDLKNCVTKKELKDATDVDMSDLTAKKYFIALNADVEKLDIDKLVNFPTGLNILKRKVDDLDVDKLETVPVDF